MNKIFQLLSGKQITHFKKKSISTNSEENEKLKSKVEKQINEIRQYSVEYLMKLENRDNLIEFELKIAHWTAFKNETDRKNFLNEIVANNFEKMSMITEQKNAFPYCLEITKKSKIDEESVADFSKLISKIVTANNGIYEYWEIVNIDEQKQISTIKIH